MSINEPFRCAQCSSIIGLIAREILDLDKSMAVDSEDIGSIISHDTAPWVAGNNVTPVFQFQIGPLGGRNWPQGPEAVTVCQAAITGPCRSELNKWDSRVFFGLPAFIVEGPIDPVHSEATSELPPV